jgi:ABC-2 type transport system ATP-binding protein
VGECAQAEPGGLTVILTTHYLEEAEEMCDEIAIIDHGKVVARDTKAALLGRLDAKTLVIEPDAAPTGRLRSRTAGREPRRARSSTRCVPRASASATWRPSSRIFRTSS